MIISGEKSALPSSLEARPIDVDKHNVAKMIGLISKHLYTSSASPFREYWLNSRESVYALSRLHGQDSPSQGQDGTRYTVIKFPSTEALCDFDSKYYQDLIQQGEAQSTFYYYKLKKFKKDGVYKTGNLSFIDVDAVPSGGDREFSIRDYGTGLSHDNILNLVAKAYSSSKSDSNDYGGGFGIGTLSAGYVADSVIITGFKDGVKSTIVFNFTDSTFVDMGTQSTKEDDGVEVRFSLRDSSETSVHEFITESLKYLAFSPMDEAAIVYTPVLPMQMFLRECVTSERKSNKVSFMTLKDMETRLGVSKNCHDTVLFRDIAAPSHERWFVTDDFRKLFGTKGYIPLSVDGCFYRGKFDEDYALDYVTERIRGLSSDVPDTWLGQEGLPGHIVDIAQWSARWNVPVGYLSNISPSREEFTLSRSETEEFFDEIMSHVEGYLLKALAVHSSVNRTLGSNDMRQALRDVVDVITGDDMIAVKEATKYGNEDVSALQFFVISQMAKRSVLRHGEVQGDEEGDEIEFSIMSNFAYPEHINGFPPAPDAIIVTSHKLEGTPEDTRTGRLSGFVSYNDSCNLHIDMSQRVHQGVEKYSFRIRVIPAHNDFVNILTSSKKKDRGYWVGEALKDDNALVDSFSQYKDVLSEEQEKCVSEFLRHSQDTNGIYTTHVKFQKRIDTVNAQLGRNDLCAASPVISGAVLDKGISKLREASSGGQDKTIFVEYKHIRKDSVRSPRSVTMPLENFAKYVSERGDIKVVIAYTSPTDPLIYNTMLMNPLRDMYSSDELIVINKTREGKRKDAAFCDAIRQKVADVELFDSVEDDILLGAIEKGLIDGIPDLLHVIVNIAFCEDRTSGSSFSLYYDLIRKSAIFLNKCHTQGIRPEKYSKHMGDVCHMANSYYLSIAQTGESFFTDRIQQIEDKEAFYDMKVTKEGRTLRDLVTSLKTSFYAMTMMMSSQYALWVNVTEQELTLLQPYGNFKQEASESLAEVFDYYMEHQPEGE